MAKLGVKGLPHQALIAGDGVVFKNIDSDGSGCTAGASATDLLETESDKDYAGTSKFVDVKYDSSVTASRYSLCDATDKRAVSPSGEDSATVRSAGVHRLLVIRTAYDI